MVDTPNNNIDPTDQSSGDMIDGNDASVETTDRRRRSLLTTMKTAAIAGPILLTLKNTPALATQNKDKGSCLSAGNMSHGGKKGKKGKYKNGGKNSCKKFDRR